MSGPLRRTMELQSIRGKALALQQSFLAAPPSISGLTISALYHPADSAAEVGGDWYDAVRLSPDALALSIGDIAGHDLDAAMAMGRVNSILRGWRTTAARPLLPCGHPEPTRPHRAGPRQPVDGHGGACGPEPHGRTAAGTSPCPTPGIHRRC